MMVLDEKGILVERSKMIAQMLSTNVNNHTEKKNNLTYLSWAWAWVIFQNT